MTTGIRRPGASVQNASVQNPPVQNPALARPGEVARILARCAGVIATDGLVRTWLRQSADREALAALARFDQLVEEFPHDPRQLKPLRLLEEIQGVWNDAVRRVPPALMARPWLGYHLAAVRLAPLPRAGGRLIRVSVATRADFVAACKDVSRAGGEDTPNAAVEYNPGRCRYTLAWATPDARG